MSLADALVAPKADTDRCPVADLLATLPERDAAALRAACEPAGRSADYIHAVLRNEGYRVAREAVERHRARVSMLRGLPRKSLPCGCAEP